MSEKLATSNINPQMNPAHGYFMGADYGGWGGAMNPISAAAMLLGGGGWNPGSQGVNLASILPVASWPAMLQKIGYSLGKFNGQGSSTGYGVSGQNGLAGGGYAQGTNSSIAGYRAIGGPVGSGNRYVVGENGPEVFVPTVPGVILPTTNQDMPMATGGMTQLSHTTTLPQPNMMGMRQPMLGLMGQEGYSQASQQQNPRASSRGAVSAGNPYLSAGSSQLMYPGGLEPTSDMQAGKFADYLTPSLPKMFMGSGTPGEFPAAGMLASLIGHAMSHPRMFGGYVSGGNPYMLGERSPEMYIPTGSSNRGAAQGMGDTFVGNSSGIFGGQSGFQDMGTLFPGSPAIGLGGDQLSGSQYAGSIYSKQNNHPWRPQISWYRGPHDRTML